MARLGFVLLGLIAAAAAACAAPDSGAATSSANDTTETLSGPLAPDATFAANGTLAMTGASIALGAAARADGTIAIARNVLGAKPATVVTLVKGDGSAATDVAIPGVSGAAVAVVLPQTDGVVVAGSAKEFFLERIDATGNLDPKFHPDPLNIDVADAAIGPNGTIVVAGTMNGSAKAVVVRLTATGSIDTSYAGGEGAWIDDATATGATHVVVDSSGIVTFITVGANGTTALRLDATGKLDPTYGKSGRASIAAVQPKHGSALIAGQQGAVTYVSSSATSDDNSAFALDANGNVTGTTPVPGTVDGATAAGLESYVTNADVCTLSIGGTTATFTTEQCGQAAPYAQLPDGRHVIAVTDPGSSTVSVHMFTP